MLSSKLKALHSRGLFPLINNILMFFSIMFWNCQIALSRDFQRTFKALVHNYKPMMVALLEPKISEKKIDNFILKSGFERSHRIEAMGFSGGIWLLWNEGFHMEILVNHKQFIHLVFLILMVLSLG